MTDGSDWKSIEASNPPVIPRVYKEGLLAASV